MSLASENKAMYSRPDSALEKSCETVCPGYGTSSHCPPMIVLASRTHGALDAQSNSDSRVKPVQDAIETQLELTRLAGAIASGDLCGCAFLTLR